MFQIVGIVFFFLLAFVCIVFFCTGQNLGSYVARQRCLIANGTELTCDITSSVLGPRLTVGTPIVDFELLNFGVPNVTCEKTLVVHNVSDIPAAFALCESNLTPAAFTDTDANVACQGQGVLSFFPGVGVVEPRASRTIRVVYQPQACQRLRTNIEVHVLNGRTVFAAARAEVQAPQVVMTPSAIPLGYLQNPPTTTSIMILS
jgi:hypothetical protein